MAAGKYGTLGLGILASISAAGGQARASSNAWECEMSGGRTARYQVTGETCRFGVQQGTVRNGQCEISDPQLRIITFDRATGALTYEDTDADTISRGVCTPARSGKRKVY